MIIRLVASEEIGTLITKTEIKQPIQYERRKKQPNTQPKLKFRVDSIQVDRSIINEFESLINNNEIWSMTNNWQPTAIHDGANWLLELKDSTHDYHMLKRHSPRDQKFREVCLFLIKLTKDSHKLEIY
ncbi:MAG: hypothetical protein ABJH04_11095 [Cyclobacteriaceae bacterium]